MSAIVALATCPGKAALHIIRLSGSSAYEIINKISLEPVEKTKDRVQLNYLKNERNQIIDKVILIKFYSPSSYTGEDLIEINVHGNNLLVRLIINELIRFGAVPAQPGEFTKIALLNNKISIGEVDNLKQLFNSKSVSDLMAATSTLDGKNTKIFKKISLDMFHLIAECEINIDYPPEIDDDAVVLASKIQEKILKILNLLNGLLKKSSLKQSSNFRILFLGKPNSGKSSLLNCLLNEEKIIVSNIAGTTRDVIETEYFYKNYILTIVDSAGIHETNDHLESIAIKKTYEEIKKADLIIYLIEIKPNKFNEKNKKKIIKNNLIFLKIQKLKHFIVYTKKDLFNKEMNLNLKPSISSKTKDLKDFYDLLDNYLKNNYFPGEIKNEYIISNIKKSIDFLTKALNKEVSLDLISEYLNLSRQQILNSLSINEDNFEKINNIFDNFCIGK